MQKEIITSISATIDEYSDIKKFTYSISKRKRSAVAVISRTVKRIIRRNYGFLENVHKLLYTASNMDD